ncbi:hypothetical protein [Shewanella donghaensis]|uniref:hypothetical protein n=1 Tax=Shewanella donghaensis TaxID=238836 RepID=UPI00118208D8|nr:hypothetical protein [Shewanella donghaensis]
MNKLLIAGVLITLSTGAAAQKLNEIEERQELDASMEQLITLDEQTDIFITVDEDASFERIAYQGFITDVYSEIYVSSHDAKEMGLEKLKKFYIYNETDIDALSVKIGLQIDQDKPTSFSIDLYRDYQQDSGKFTYVARIIEYK